MNRGAWHQCGDKSQKLVKEQLENGVGVGVIISPRDLKRPLAVAYSTEYRSLGAQVLFDQQFYIPDYLNQNLRSYPISTHRVNISALHGISDNNLSDLSNKLEDDNRAIQTHGIIAPAIVYEAGRPDINSINRKLFDAAKLVGDVIGIPTYATVFLGRSITSSMNTVNTALSAATSLNSDGWYFGFEFEPERIPSDKDSVIRCMNAGITLACTGKPVLHGYAGPISLLSFAFGATGAAVGHSQNLWHFSRTRWQPTSGQGGGGDAPSRFFSKSLWGTLIIPDETAQLPQQLNEDIMIQSPFSPVSTTLPWDRWAANKHLVHIICSEIAHLESIGDPRSAGRYSINVLDSALTLFGQIAQTGLILRDGTASYQSNWKDALNEMLNNHQSDYDFLEMLS